MTQKRKTEEKRPNTKAAELHRIADTIAEAAERAEPVTETERTEQRAERLKRWTERRAELHRIADTLTKAAERADTEEAERGNVVTFLAWRLFDSYIPTQELIALLDNGKRAPFWAFAELPEMAKTKRAQRKRSRTINGRKDKRLTVEDINAVIDDLAAQYDRVPTPKEVCGELSTQRGTEYEGERKAVSRLLNGAPWVIWDTEQREHSIEGGEGMTLTEYIRMRTRDTLEIFDD